MYDKVKIRDMACKDAKLPQTAAIYRTNDDHPETLLRKKKEKDKDKEIKRGPPSPPGRLPGDPVTPPPKRKKPKKKSGRTARP